MKPGIQLMAAGVLLAQCIVHAAAAGPFESGLAAANARDYATAVQLLRPIAEQGSAEAQYAVGVLYDNGQGVVMDHAAATGWFRKAAEQGYSPAEFALALAYDYGRGATHNDSMAAYWYRKAADQGDPAAQFNLANMHVIGRAVPKDPVQAYMWFSVAMSRFAPADTTNRNSALKARDSLAATMTPAQLTEAQRLARLWTPR